MEKKHHVKLNDQERAHIEKMTNVAKTPKTLKKRCQVLLLADEVAGKPPSYEEIAARCGVSDVTAPFPKKWTGKPARKRIKS